MNNFLRIILALLLTPAYLIADENVKPAKPENDDEQVEEAKKDDESEDAVEEEVETGNDGLVGVTTYSK